MANPLVSVVIPTFNRAETLERSLVSVLNQTVREIEVLVMDDGSTDQTREVLAQFQDARLVIHYLVENSGSPAYPRNIGVEKSCGKWIAFLDSDDWWEPNHLASQLEVMERTGARASCGNALNHFANETKSEQIGPLVLKTHHVALPTLVDLAALLKGNLIITSSVVIRREDVIRAEGFSLPVVGPVFEDYALWLRVATFTDFAVSDETTVHYQTASPDSHGATKGYEESMRNTVFELQSWLRRVTASSDEVPVEGGH
jgi:teichuronic acid biosynthesis glycosyltransferase TuaG